MSDDQDSSDDGFGHIPDNDNDEGDIFPSDIIVPEDAPGTASEIFLRLYDSTANIFTVTGEEIDSSVFADVSNDVLFTFGDDGSDAAANGDLPDIADLLFAGSTPDSGNDALLGGTGDDFLQRDIFDTDQASDRFAFAANDGNDVFENIQAGLGGYDFSDFGDAVTLHEEDGNAVLSIGDISVTLEGVSVTELSAEDLQIATLDDDFDFLAN
jgi:hypothetical protein